MTHPTPPETSEPVTSPPRRPRGTLVLLIALGVVVVVSSVVVVGAIRHHVAQDRNQLLRASGLPASIPTALADLMLLSPIRPQKAPGFTLTDQTGRTLSLSGFRGRAVVLEFMDPHCVDICPLISREFVDAYHDLGAGASRVVFIAVNVNQYFASTSSVAAFSRAHQLDTIPSWHFFTGTTPHLRAVWRDYGVVVEAPHPNADIVHTSVIYFIDPRGRERYVASPVADHTQSGTAYLPAASLTSWGRGIALVAKSLTR